MMRWLTRTFHLLMLFLLPLTVGAVWSVAMQLTRRDLPWLALAMPLAVLAMRGQLGFLPCVPRAALHGLAAAIGIAYAQALSTGVQVAAQFGYEPLAALRTMGPTMTGELIALKTTAGDAAIAVVAIAIATAIGARSAVKRRSVP